MAIAPVGVDCESAERYGRQVAVALARGNWDHAHQVIATARHEFETAARGSQFADPREMCLNETPIPSRLVTILQNHGMFTVGDLLLVGIDYIAERRNIGPCSVETILEALLELGITRDQFSGGNHG